MNKSQKQIKRIIAIVLVTICLMITGAIALAHNNEYLNQNLVMVQDGKLNSQVLLKVKKQVMLLVENYQSIHLLMYGFMLTL